MASEQERRIEQVFYAALEKVTDAERAAYLDGACADDPGLRAQVEDLLHAHAEAGTFLDTPAANLRPTRVTGVAEGPGTRIGRYKLLQQIGEGGFGVVYMAEQEEPVRRKVALKIIKLGMDTKQVIARFEAERQALAMMDHPNIARVFDAGATESGRPYFVMELVKGITVTQYCDQNRLATAERLELFMQTCRAVQHAHQKGIIHRDIKPNNVLVTLHDSRPVPKVIDFGIAKATGQRLTDRTLFTEFRQFIGTPEYMSPDQAEISGLDVDTRSDIYSLGVLLYELLTGTTPFDATTLRRATYAEIQRIIREVDPPKPSTRLATLAQSGGGEAMRRRPLEPVALSRLLRGDLDWIVMKALEKDRTRRYQTAAELAEDVARYLRDEPVLAGPPGTVYKLRKFVRRNQASVGASLLILLALVAGLSAAAVGFVRAREEARRSQRIADFLQELFVTTRPDEALARGIDVNAVLATARALFGDDHATVAAVLSSRAEQLQSLGDLEGAERLFHESLRVRRERFGADSVEVGATLSALGMLQMLKGDNVAAEAAYREALAIMRAAPAGETLTMSETLHLMASVLVNRGEYAEAEQLLREAIRIRRTLAPTQRVQIALQVNSLANVMAIGGRNEQLRPVMAEVVAAWRAALPERGPMIARILTECAVWYLKDGDRETAERLVREALAIFRALLEPSAIHHRMALGTLRELLLECGQETEIIPLALEAIELGRRSDNAENVREAQQELANVCWRIVKDPQRTPEDYATALAGAEAYLAQQPDAPSVLNTLGVAQFRLGRYADALVTLARSDEHYAALPDFGGGAPHDVAFIAMAHQQLGQTTEAQAALARLRALMSVPRHAGDAEARALAAEAEALCGGATSRPAAGE